MHLGIVAAVCDVSTWKEVDTMMDCWMFSKGGAGTGRSLHHAPGTKIS